MKCYRCFSVLLMLILIVLPLTQSFAVSEAAVLFLLISPSPRANGMGNAFTALSGDDPFAMHYNPAFLGALSREHFFSGGFYPCRTGWLPSLVDDMYYTHTAVSLGFNFNEFLPYLPISVGIGYYRTYLDYGQFLVTTPDQPEGTGISQEYGDTASGIALGVGLDLYLRLNAGITFKRIHSELAPMGVGMERNDTDGEANAVDVGFLMEFPVIDLINRITKDKLTFGPGFTGMWVPSFSLAWCNIGDEISYTEAAQADPLPRCVRFGIGEEIGFIWKKGEIQWKLASVRGAIDCEDLLIKRDAGEFEYRSGLGDINVFENIILNRGNDSITKSSGVEINMAESFFLRFGRYEDIEGRVNYRTSGFGISLAGLQKLLIFVVPGIRDSEIANFIFSRLDIQYNQSHVHFDEAGHPIEDTVFRSITLSF